MHDALRTLDRDVVYSLSNSAPYGDAPQWMRYSNCWRTTGDIRDTWESISSIGFSQDRWLPFNRPGHWADPDMLVIGMVGWGPKLHYTQLTADEQATAGVTPGLVRLAVGIEGISDILADLEQGFAAAKPFAAASQPAVSV